ncbi:MAG: hypothetical protein B6245_17485 [Desulfobacteraceae bacterium 4572_88]|nr:MAG: hypothetical protein B6245_17485 [Desulfobacteraceae bacterium 4572_88]
MRKFSSYGPVSKKLNYYVPREELISRACLELIGEDADEGGHYITVWAPRQCGKSWLMREVLWKLGENDRFHVLKLNLEHLKMVEDADEIAASVGQDLIRKLSIENVSVSGMKDFHTLFLRKSVEKPLILIMDEFDALPEEAIGSFAGIFRNIYNIRREDSARSEQKEYLLHAVALIGVRAVLGVENAKGSPFNVQQSLHIPNLTHEEVCAMFEWYERESGQKVGQEVPDRLFNETRGQPGLVSWFGELLTEGFEEFVPDKTRAITGNDFERVYTAAIQILPNNNIINIISKARQEPHKRFVLDMFRSDKKIPFEFDDPDISFLYMNGVIDRESDGWKHFARFSSSFVQRRLFNYFSRELFPDMGRLIELFDDLSDIFGAGGLGIRCLIRRYEKYLHKNRDWLLKDAPRRKDLRVTEAVYHFNLYEYLKGFFANKTARVWPEFPTGNGAIDLIIEHEGKRYGLELKSYTDESDYSDALKQAARYGNSLKLPVIHLIVFVEDIPDEYRKKYEKNHIDEKTGVTVKSVFVATGGK